MADARGKVVGVDDRRDLAAVALLALGVRPSRKWPYVPLRDNFRDRNSYMWSQKSRDVSLPKRNKTQRLVRL